MVICSFWLCFDVSIVVLLGLLQWQDIMTDTTKLRDHLEKLMKVDGEEIVKVQLNIRLIDCWLTSHWGFFVIIWMQEFLSICINVLHNTCNIHIGSKDIMNCQRKASKLGPNFCAYCPWPVRDLYPATPSMSDCVFLFYYNFKWLIELHL